MPYGYVQNLDDGLLGEGVLQVLEDARASGILTASTLVVPSAAKVHFLHELCHAAAGDAPWLSMTTVHAELPASMTMNCPSSCTFVAADLLPAHRAEQHGWAAGSE